ncbi:Isoquinoline 1-oxidoreductase subunit alpha [wastewater metagenome]|uniref:Isoquinoline 1-oxidoreductase subunit alpha n=2 Tax=unclassified sequences TaxID=12908 RepID=A0A5B8RF00_9ZZZZ|nr:MULTISPECIES: (2Fe-2S)-binding protein [Arhodomonas]MCS4505423.1 (2Fe-2S)-binding protein [Arhodomonas aquaeolei]QEA06094.1 isoquinoline 1-oxidoreductase subunit alpha [uncultured organism]
MSITLKVNGKTHSVDVDADTPLLWVLRDELRLTGTKYGCGISQCGACTVHLDGSPTRSCVLPVQSVGDRSVTTIEGLESPAAAAVQKAWAEMDVPQCGYCQSGQVMSAVGLLEQTPQPDDDAIDGAMRGNVCRCATYQRIRAAIHRAAGELEA